jgi:hypothetical protein
VGAEVVEHDDVVAFEGRDAAEQRRSMANAAREAWFEEQLDLDPARIVFVDETAANTKMARLFKGVRRGASDAALPCSPR